MTKTRLLGLVLLLASTAALAGPPVTITDSNNVAAATLTGTSLDVNITGGSSSTSAGDVAHDAADSGNPVKVGGKAGLAAPSAVADNDRVNAWYGRNGQASTQIVNSTGSIVTTRALGDAQGGGSNHSLDVFAVGGNFNGSTYDRTRGDTSGTFIQGPASSGSAVAGKPVLQGGSDGTNARTLTVDTTGVLGAPKTGTADRVVTKTNMTLNTSTTVCPTATSPVSTEIFFSTANVGISLAGGTLTQATLGTTASTHPDLVFSVANTLYTFPVAPTNAITAYGAAGIIVCIQHLRQ